MGVVVSINKNTSACWVAVKQRLLHRAYVHHVLKPVPNSNNLDVTWTCGMLMKAGGHCLRSLRERQLVLYCQLGDRTSFTATAGEAATQTAARARKQIGFAAPVATGIASVARITM